MGSTQLTVILRIEQDEPFDIDQALAEARARDMRRFVQRTLGMKYTRVETTIESVEVKGNAKFFVQASLCWPDMSYVRTRGASAGFAAPTTSAGPFPHAEAEKVCAFMNENIS